MAKTFPPVPESGDVVERVVGVEGGGVCVQVEAGVVGVVGISISDG